MTARSLYTAQVKPCLASDKVVTNDLTMTAPDDDPADPGETAGVPRLAEVLRLMKTTRDDLALLEYTVVQMLRDGGASWEDIGEELGISRQAASERFAHPKHRRNRGKTLRD